LQQKCFYIARGGSLWLFVAYREFTVFFKDRGGQAEAGRFSEAGCPKEGCKITDGE
jgi:hypothetical protein